MKWENDSTSESSPVSLVVVVVDETIGFEAMILDDILFYMMRYIWTTDMFYPCSLVCKRWSEVQKKVQLNFETTRSIAHGIYLDNTHLARIAQDPRMDMVTLDSTLLKALCRIVRTRELIDSFLKRGLSNRRQWQECLGCAIDKNNTTALESLLSFDAYTIVRPAEADEILRRACIRMNTSAIRILCKRFPDVMNPRLEHPALAQWCCRQKLIIPLFELLDHDAFRTRNNMVRILPAALKCDTEALTYKLIRIDAANMRIHSLPILKRACQLGWTDVCKALLIDIPLKLSAGVGQHLLNVAIANSRVEVVKMLIGHTDAHPGRGKNQPIRDAILMGNAEIALFLLSDKRINVASHVTAQESLLCLACAQKTLCVSFVRTLLCNYPEIDPNEFNDSPIRISATIRNYDVLRVLLKHHLLKLSSSNHTFLLDSLAEVEGCNDLIEDLIKSKKYAHHFGSPMRST